VVSCRTCIPDICLGTNHLSRQRNEGLGQKGTGKEKNAGKERRGRKKYESVSVPFFFGRGIGAMRVKLSWLACLAVKCLEGIKFR
jgi:hypothetical protein